MTKREHVIQAAKIAGYHNDTRTFTRLIIECPVNRQIMNQAFNVGAIAKANGMKCSCYDCNHQTTQTV